MSTRNLDAALSVRVDSIRGYSAYEIAVQHGYTGTEEQWIASLSGNNCTINGVSHDSTYDFKVNATNLPMSAASDAVKISAKITELNSLITAANTAITALQTAVAAKLATANVYNGVDKTVSGYALDARQGTVLKALCDDAATKTELTALESKVNSKVSLYTASVTLPSASWTTGGTQTVTVEHVTSDSAVIVAAGSSTIAAYYTAGVYCSSQADGTLTFKYTTLPTVDLAVNVMILCETETETE